VSGTPEPASNTRSRAWSAFATNMFTTTAIVEPSSETSTPFPADHPFASSGRHGWMGYVQIGVGESLPHSIAVTVESADAQSSPAYTPASLEAST
jgi:hypothetical protein